MPVPTYTHEPTYIIHKEAEELLKLLQSKSEQNVDVTVKSGGSVSMTASECETLCTAIGLKYKEGFEKRVIQFRFTDDTADRHNEVIIPAGVDLKSFNKDPTILLQHNSYTFPIGKSLETKYDIKHNDVVGKILFFDDETDRTGMSETTFRMIKAGAIKTGSIGFRARPENVRMASPEEIKKYKLDKFGIIFDKIELREFSIVTIPANPNAVQISSRKGMYTQTALKTLREKGSPEEELKMLSEDVITSIEHTSPSETTPDVSNVHTSNENKINVKLFVHDTDSSDQRILKLDYARELSATGCNVAIILFGREEKDENIIGNIEKAGAVLSKKNKELIQNALTSITNLKADLETVLNITTDDKHNPDKDDVNTIVLKGSTGEEHDPRPDMYSLVEKLQNKINTKQIKN